MSHIAIKVRLYCSMLWVTVNNLFMTSTVTSTNKTNISRQQAATALYYEKNKFKGKSKVNALKKPFNNSLNL